MEAGMKDKPTEGEKPKFLGQAGWVKKAPGRLLASYKDRYIKVEKTEILVYENEDLQTCIERLDLENYGKCLELKSPFKKKNRLILIRSAKPGNKVSDVKFQAASAEEKDAWIKALTDGISRAQNKVFDEASRHNSPIQFVLSVRAQPQPSQSMPTMFPQVAVVSSDGILRLDLDLEDAVMPNGTHHANTEGAEPTKDVITDPVDDRAQLLSPHEKEISETSPKKIIIKPPMPPTKESKPCVVLEDEPDKDDAPQKDPRPPKTPSKDAKPLVTPTEEDTEESDPETILGEIPDDRVKPGSPPTPPNKSSSSSLTEASHCTRTPHSPVPPAREVKASHPVVDPDQEFQVKAAEDKESSGDNREEMTGSALETDEEDLFISKGEESVINDAIPSAEGHASEEVSGSYTSPSPFLTKKTQMESAQTDTPDIQDVPPITQGHQGHPASLQTASDTADACPVAVEPIPKARIPAAVASVDPFADGLSSSPLLCHLPGKKGRSEEKSLDSGQHSDDESEGSVSEDTTVASRAAVRRSRASLDVLDVSEGNFQVSGQLPDNISTMIKPQVRSKGFPFPQHKPTLPLKPQTKARSASIGDLLSDSTVCIQVRQHAKAQSDHPQTANVMKLGAEVAQEMEKTDELLTRISQLQHKGDRDGLSEKLLAEAMEKLKKADRVLREVRKMKLPNNPISRKSW